MTLALAHHPGTALCHADKQNDGNDGAMEMLYHTLPGQTWLDKHAKDRSTDGMTAGVVESNIFIAVLSPAYFDSVYCCLEMYTAMSLRKPILCSFNLSKHKISEALAMIPPELDALKKVEVQPVHEDTEWMEMVRAHGGRLAARTCPRRTASLERLSLHLVTPHWRCGT